MFPRLSLSLGFCSRKYASAPLPSVAFIGLGNMGSCMAANLLKAGYPVHVFDVSEKAVALAVQQGAVAASSPSEAASKAEVVTTMLPSSPHVQSVYLEGETSVVAGARPGTLCIDSSTIDPNVSRSVAKSLHSSGLHVVDAPVSGGVPAASAGTLTFMVGGSEVDFRRAMPLLQVMGKNVVHCGNNGDGQVAKVCNNLILGISMMAVSEALNLGVSLGADPAMLSSVINTSSGQCWSSTLYNPVPGVLPGVPSSRDYEGGFGTDLMKKDLGLANIAADTVGCSLPMGKHALDAYQAISDAGFGKKDFSVAYKWLQQLREQGSSQ